MQEYRVVVWAGKSTEAVNSIELSIKLPTKMPGAQGLEKWHASASLRAHDFQSTMPFDSLSSDFDALHSAQKLLRDALRNYVSIRAFKLYQKRGGGKYREISLEQLFSTQDYQVKDPIKSFEQIKPKVIFRDPMGVIDELLLDLQHKQSASKPLPGVKGLKLNDELKDFWAKVGGESGEGLFKPGYAMLAVEDSLKIHNREFFPREEVFLQDCYPIFQAPNQFYIVFNVADACVYAVNLMWEDLYKIAGSLDDYLRFLKLGNESVFHKIKPHPQDPSRLPDEEKHLLLALKNKRVFPLVQDVSTVLDWVFSD